MTFKDWIYSNYPPNSSIGGQWGFLHILTLVLCVFIILILAISLRKEEESKKQRVIKVLALFILIFEIARRVINLSRGNITTLQGYLGCLLPRPWCAISCWLIIISAFAKKQFLYNITSMTALLNALIFFAYPSVGFNNKYILFENLYSISTHALLLITSITLITLGLANFRYCRPKFRNGMLKEIIVLAVIFAYAFLEIYVLKIEADPLYFMDGNDVQDILGLTHKLYLIVYSAFLVFYFNVFYLIQLIVKRKRID